MQHCCMQPCILHIMQALCNVCMVDMHNNILIVCSGSFWGDMSFSRTFVQQQLLVIGPSRTGSCVLHDSSSLALFCKFVVLPVTSCFLLVCLLLFALCFFYLLYFSASPLLFICLYTFFAFTPYFPLCLAIAFPSSSRTCFALDFLCVLTTAPHRCSCSGALLFPTIFSIIMEHWFYMHAAKQLIVCAWQGLLACICRIDCAHDYDPV